MEKHVHNMLGYTLFFVGLIFLVESIVFIFVISQIPTTMLGSTTAIAWGYAAVKFLAGLLAIYTSLAHGQKK